MREKWNKECNQAESKREWMRVKEREWDREIDRRREWVYI